ncbi:hypothetical protein [Streptomyces sp. NPDC008137]|uniref:hypothetical protein n=1 Tax=Streptomyces sp. NPDC008137 TaxID=3364813 RepID=UPI0036EAC8E8
MTTVDKPSVADAGVDPELTGIRALGYSNKLPTASDWFYFDGRLRVPAGVRIKELAYSAAPGEPATDRAAESHLADGLSSAYEVIEIAMLDDYTDLITFSLRTDLRLGQRPWKDGETKGKMTVSLTLTDGRNREAVVDVEVLSTMLTDKTARSQRPWVQLPAAIADGKRTGNACFGYVTPDGKIPAGKFTIDLVNIREREKMTSNHADHVYYQLVHQDGSPSRFTPQPVRQAVGGHRYCNPTEKDPGQPWAMPTLDLHASGDTPGYYRLLVWPQATDDPGGPTSALSWDHTKQEDAFQIGSVYYRYHAQGSGTSHDGHKENDKTKTDDQKKDGVADEHELAIFQVTDAIPRVQTDGKESLPQFLCIAMTSADEQPVNIDNLVVEVHAPTGLVFTGEAGYAYFDRLENWRFVAPTGVIGELEDGNRTLILKGPLHLFTSDKDRPFLGYGLHVVADKKATPGTYDDGHATFGKHHKRVMLTGTVIAP